MVNKTLGLYIIHDPSCTEREQFFNTVVCAVGVKPTRVWVKPVSMLTNADRQRACNGLSDSELSLTLNHEFVVNDIVLKGYDYALLIEDDTFVTNPDIFALFLAKLRDGHLDDLFDACYLGAGCKPNIYDHIPLANNQQFLLIPNEIRSTEAIVYSQEGARKCADLLKNAMFDKPLDHWLVKTYKSVGPSYRNVDIHPYVIHQATLLNYIPSSIQHTA